MDERIRLRQTLLEGLESIPLLDVHTHLDASHLTARGLHDILLYHMLVSELGSAGCPSRARLSEDPDAAEAHARLAEAVPYLKYIRNTSLYWATQMTLEALYGWQEPVTEGNWKRLDGLIRERAGEPGWADEIMGRAGIRRACTEYWRRRDGSQDRLLDYSVEWAFFARSQWGVDDMAVFELERTWNQDGPSRPLPVTIGANRPPAEKVICTVADVHAAMRHYVDCIPFDQVISTAQHISTDIHYRQVSEGEMEAALRRRDQASTQDRDIYASYIFDAFLTQLEQHAGEIVFHFSIGAEPLPYETGSKLRQDTVFDLAAMIDSHPRLRFQALLSSEHSNQAMCTLARELPNLSLAGYWWHNFFPGVMRKVIADRLDMLPVNKQVGFFSDAYCLEWAYAKAALVRRQWAAVLAEKIEQGQYTLDEALSIARETMYETPKSLVGMRS